MAEVNEGASGRRRRETKETRREQLMDATLTVLARRGLAKATLADVADEAGLSRGIVNFHFESKERLLLATLERLSSEYDATWRQGLAAAGPTAAERLRALMMADLSPGVCEPQKLAAWFAFFAESGARVDYRDLCWARDDALLDAFQTLCEALETEARYGYDARRTAMAIYAMQEGFWLRLMLGNTDLTREDALAIALGMLGTLFPKHFTAEGTVRAAA
ncbi:MAG: TetR family transcriptional regulator C-terminal domain-containing protein [Pseudomonadota bacterium]